MANKKAIPSAVRRAVVLRDNGICRYCGKKGRANIIKSWASMEHEFDHVLPEHLGGQAAEDNIVTACQHCNRSKGHKMLDEWGKQLIPIVNMH